jgi:hypothetical protein
LFIAQVFIANKIPPRAIKQLLLTNGQFEYIWVGVVLKGADLFNIIDVKINCIQKYK